MDLSYFQKINNTYKSSSKQETDLFLLNRHVDDCFADTIDYHIVECNGEPFELIIIKDTDGNTHKKKIKAKHSTPFNLGDYIKWNGQMWLVLSLDPDDKTYNSGYMYLCTLLLHWQNEKGDIIERWGYSEDYTKYSSGVKGGKTLSVGDNQYGVTLPVDSETKYLKRDKRFIIDFEDVDVPDTYDLTNRKVFLSDDGYFGRGSLVNLTLSYGAFNSKTDKLVKLPDGRNVWICDYKTPSPPSQPDQPLDEPDSLTAVINGNTNIKIGIPRTYTADLLDKDSNVVTWDDSFAWKIASDFDVSSVEDGNKIKLLIEDEAFIDERLCLEVVNNDNVIGSLAIIVVSIF